jgi:hypothetical protein
MYPATKQLIQNMLHETFDNASVRAAAQIAS